MQRPNMRFVPVKTEEQQSRLMVHRARQGFVTERTACINRIRGLLSEFGIVLPLKAEVVRQEARNHLEDLPGYAVWFFRIRLHWPNINAAPLALGLCNKRL